MIREEHHLNVAAVRVAPVRHRVHEGPNEIRDAVSEFGRLSEIRNGVAELRAERRPTWPTV